MTTMTTPTMLEVAPGAMTLADVLDRLVSDTTLSSTRRRDCASAIRSLCRMIAVSPADAPATHPFLRKRLKGFHPMQAGIGEKRFQNIRADVTFAIKRYAAAVPGERCWQGIPEEWKRLSACLTPVALQYSLSRFIRFCGRSDILPGAVNDTTIEAYRAYLADETSVTSPERIVRVTIKHWNRAVAAVPGFPPRLLTAERRSGYCPRYEDLPPALRTDADAWLGRLSGDDRLADDGPLRPLRPASIEARRFQIRQIVAALVSSGREIDRLGSLADLVAPEAAKVVLRFFLMRSGGQPTSQTAGIAGALLAIARHHVQAPAEHIRELQRLKRKVTSDQTGLTAKNRARLCAFDSERNKLLLVNLPQQMLAEAKRHRRPRSDADVLVVQTAVIIEILLMLPMRLRNLTRLDLERHIVRHRDRHGERVHIVIPGQEVKNREDLEAALPAESVRLLDLYLAQYRPRLATSPSRWLFPGMRPDTPKCPEVIGRQIKKAVFARTGLVVNPHLFRHIGAKLFLDAHPGEHETVRRVLRHRSIDTTTNHYTGLETAAAARRYDQVILGLRRQAAGETQNGN